MTSGQDGKPLFGVAIVTCAVFLFACTDTVTKYLSPHYSAAFIQAMRYLVNLFLLLILVLPRHGASLWATRRTGLVWFRGAVLGFASLTMGLALKVMPVGETVSIVYMSPFAVMLLSGPLLGEKVKPAAWFGAVFAFSGVLLVMRPGGGLDPVGVVFALINACLSTAYHLLTRVLTRTETTRSLMFHVAVIGSVILCVMAYPTIPDHIPPPGHLILFALIGAFATGGHFLFTAAYRLASPAVLAPVHYVQIMWSAALGWAVFGHMPAPLSLLGMAMVLLAGVGVALAIGRPRQPPPPR